MGIAFTYATMSPFCAPTVAHPAGTLEQPRNRTLSTPPRKNQWIVALFVSTLSLFTVAIAIASLGNYSRRGSG